VREKSNIANITFSDRQNTLIFGEVMPTLQEKVHSKNSCGHACFEELPLEDEFYFQWHITERCNQRCTHCYHESYDAGGELDREQLLESADQMLAAAEKWGKYASFSLTGGEPFIRRDDLLTLANYLDGKERNAYYDILTNGALLNGEIVSELADLGKLRRVQLSFEGASPETNDRIRGEGSFDKTISAVRLLKGAELTVSVMTTVSRANSREILPLIDILENEGVDTFALERFIPEGQGKKIDSEAMSAEEVREVFQAVYEVGRIPRDIRVLMYRPLFGILDSEDLTIGAMCSVGTNALTIMHDGTVLPCRRLPVPLGNIRTDSLFKIWYDSPMLWEIRNPSNLKGKCDGCELIPICRGCRAVAYANTGDYLAEDPQCWI